jgi:ubiquinone/menaquinone biosynthesis C-methylase UbiE
MNDNQVLEQVRSRYGAIAQTALDSRESSCCGGSATGAASAESSCCAPVDAIPAEALAALQEDAPLPDEIVRTSLGCGTPLELAQVKPGETVLDLGSGGGLDCFYAAKLAGPLGHIIGVDMTPEMLALAEKNKQATGLTNVEFRKGTIENLPVDDDSVDVIISNCVINLSTEKDRVFREAYRVLKPGGRVVFSDIVARREIPSGLRKNMDAWASCVAGAITAAEYRAQMDQAGFQGVEVQGEAGLNLVYSARFLGRKTLD